MLNDKMLKNGPIYSRFFSDRLWTKYKGGIWTDCDWNDQKSIGALAVGYGFENGVRFYKLRGVRGPRWGENGYFRMGETNSYCQLTTLYSLYIPPS